MGTNLETDGKPGSPITWSVDWKGKPYRVSGGTQLVLNQDNNSSREEADRNRDNWQQTMQGLKNVAES